MVISLFFSIFTSWGWTASLLFVFGGVAAYIGLFAITLIISLFLNFKSKKNQVVIPTKFAIFIIIFQVFLILFNVGDCGRGFNQFGNFIQRAIAGFPVCYDIVINNWIPYNIIILGFVLNFILLIIFVIKTLLSAKEIDEK